MKSYTVLCVASFFKGNDFIRECARLGARVVLVTRQKLMGRQWAWESVVDVVAVPDQPTLEHYLEAGIQLGRRHALDRVVALEEYDILHAAAIAEDLCIAGLGVTTGRFFHDKLAMSVKARERGIPIPDCVHLLNGSAVDDFLGRTPGPWMLKPRVGASAMGMRKLARVDEVWRCFDELDAQDAIQDRGPAHVLQQFLPGSVFSVNSLVFDRDVVFANITECGTPPFQVVHEGGVASYSTVRRGSADERALLALNRSVLDAFGFERGTTHIEFIKSASGDGFYFLEAAARVGGAFTVETVEAATGINLWREWARIELGDFVTPYRAPRAEENYAGLAVSLARQEAPDTSEYTDPEIVFRVSQPQHVGLVVRASKYERIEELLGSYVRRFEEDFLAVAPAEGRADSHL